MSLKLKRSTFFLAVASVLSCNAALADTASIDINDDAFSFEYKATNASSNLDISAGLLHHKDDGQLYALGAHVEGQSLQNSNISGSLGAKAYWADLDNGGDGVAVGLGGFANFLVPNVDGLSFQIDAYYAPSVLSFNDIEHLIDFEAKAMYRVLDNGSVYLGYRKANIDLEDVGDADLDEGFHIGITLDL